MKRTKYVYMFGIGFWTGAGVYSFINMIMNIMHRPNVLTYDCIITGVAIFGLILNIILLKKVNKRGNN